MPTIAVISHFAFGLSDWTPLNVETGKILAYIIPSAIAVGLVWITHRFSRAGLISTASLCIGLLIALQTGFLLLGAPSFI